MNRRVVITGAGAISSIADRPDAFHAKLCEGADHFLPVEDMELGALEGVHAIGVKGFSPEAYLGDHNFRPLDRTGRLTVTAASLALDSGGWTSDSIQEYEVGLFLGTVFCGLKTIMEFDRNTVVSGPKYAKPMDFANTVINAAAGQTAVWHDLRGINSTVASGSASGLTAIIQAAEAIRGGHANALLAGGSEELCFESLFTFFQTGMLATDRQSRPVPFDVDSGGFAHGEGSALLMLESLESAQKRGATILAEIKGYAEGYDPSRGKDKERGRKSVASAMTRALRQANTTPDEIDAVCASANGSRNQDLAEAKALSDVFGNSSPAVTAPKSVIGECLGAGGAFQALTMMQSFVSGKLPGVAGLGEAVDALPKGCVTDHARELDPNMGLVNAVGYDGACASLVMANYRGIS